MNKQISFIHAADLHLDSPFKGLAHVSESIFSDIRNSTFHALDRLVKTAINKQVDFVLIVGDLFENEVQSLRAQIHLRHAFEILKQHQINVYLSYGNHDHINGNIYPVTYPENVFIFPNEQISSFVFEKNDEPLAQIYGFSYENRSIQENKAVEYEKVNGEIPYHIAMLHGSYLGNTEHHVYAPFKKSDVLKENFDYWALGHIHKRQIIESDPLVVYPGNTQGRHRKESGQKGCYHVVLTDTGPKLEFISLAPIQFERVSFNLSHYYNIHDVEMKIQDMFENHFQTTSSLLIEFEFTSDTPYMEEWENTGLIEELIDFINEAWQYKKPWRYIYSYHTYSQSTTEQEIKGEYFTSELIKNIENASIPTYINDLYRHRHAQKYLDTVSQREEQQIKKRAERLLFELLRNGGRKS